MTRLTPKDKIVLRAFIDKKTAESKKIITDGKRLDGQWLGGLGIAKWENGKVYIFALGGRSAQTVQRALKREVPEFYWGGYKEHKNEEAMSLWPIEERGGEKGIVDGYGIGKRITQKDVASGRLRRGEVMIEIGVDLDRNKLRRTVRVLAANRGSVVVIPLTGPGAGEKLNKRIMDKKVFSYAWKKFYRAISPGKTEEDMSIWKIGNKIQEASGQTGRDRLHGSDRDLYDAIMLIAENDRASYQRKDAKGAVKKATREHMKWFMTNLREEIRGVEGAIVKDLTKEWASH
jgi:hypothetical protein